MSVFTYTYDLATPAGSDLANTLDTVIQTEKNALEERFNLEHQSLVTGTNDTDSPTAMGRHIPGRVSVVKIDTASNIAALTGMYTGALAYDTTNGRLLIYNGSNWTTYPISGTPSAAASLAFYAYLSSRQNVNSTSFAKVQLNAELYDYGSKFASYKFTPGVAGIYHFSASVEATGGYRTQCAIYKNGSAALKGSINYNYADTAETLTSVVSGDIVSDSNDYFELYVRNESSSNTAEAGAAVTFMCGHLIASL